MPDQKRRVIIRHPDGREYSVLPRDFTVKDVSPERESYAEQGFRIVSYIGGAEYDGPKTAHEIEKAAEERAAARAERAAVREQPAALPEAKASA